MSSTRGPKRQSFHYDSDDGLMDEIQKVTAPPGKTFPKATKEEIVSQKNWKSVNAQWCIVCREGGELLCCDTCPASFHLICHEPVIHKDEIPAGKWMCNRCAHTPPHLLKPVSELDPEETEEDRNRRATQRVMENADPTADPLDILAQAALAVNAQQFELPADYYTLNVPYDYIKGRKKDLFNLRCRMCAQITENKPLTKCDFCEDSYHLDCLDPPLCGQPKGKWLCPNHIHPIVEHKLLKTSSVVERKQIWEDFAMNKFQELTILKAFFKKTRKINRKNKDKMPRGVEKGIVKQTVKEMYRKRFDGREERLAFATEEERTEFVYNLAKMHRGVVENTTLKDDEARMFKKDIETVVRDLLDTVVASLSTGDTKPNQEVKTESRAEALKDGKSSSEGEQKTEYQDIKNLYENCLERLHNCTDPAERLHLTMASQRYEQLKRQTTIVKKGRIFMDNKFYSPNFLPEYPIMAVLKAEGDVAPIAVQRTTTSIGFSAKCTVQLTPAMNGGRVCSAQSGNHATIVFDKIAQCFELTPTGCSQVTVDDVLYGSTLSSPPCFCSPVSQTPLEQSAPLRHGSTIQIGCSRFVFASFY